MKTGKYGCVMICVGVATAVIGAATIIGLIAAGVCIGIRLAFNIPIFGG